MDIKEIALKVWYSNNECMPADGMDKLTEFAETLVAEIQRQSEPVGYFQEEFYCGSPLVQQVGRQYVDEPGVFPLFAFPPSIEALEDKVAEACACVCDLLSNGRDEDSFARAIRSGEWKKFMKGE